MHIIAAPPISRGRRPTFSMMRMQVVVPRSAIMALTPVKRRACEVGMPIWAKMAGETVDF